MKFINALALTISIVGCVNWGLIGLFNFNLVEALFGNISILTTIIYILVGISGLWAIMFYKEVSDN